MPTMTVMTSHIFNRSLKNHTKQTYDNEIMSCHFFKIYFATSHNSTIESILRKLN